MGTIQITDTKVSTAEALIEFMHRGEVSNLEPEAVELFKLSYKYEIQPLTVS